MARGSFRSSRSGIPGTLSPLRHARKSRIWASGAKCLRPLLPEGSASAKSRLGRMDPEPLAPIATYEDLAGMIDHSLVKPELTNQDLIEGLELAKRYRIASDIVRPCDIDLTVRTLQGSPVRPGSVCGFPHGTAGTATKLY